MIAHADCITCMFRQVQNTVREITDDPAVTLAVMQRLGAKVATLELNANPALVSKHVYTITSEVTGIADPFAEQKRESNAMALRVLPVAREAVMAAPDPFSAAIHLAAVGNMIDAGIGNPDHGDVETDIERMLELPFGIFDLDDFRSELGPGKRLLYLGDNAGEIVFDTVLVDLIGQTGTEVTYSVKSGPIINDATMEDAETAGMANFAHVIETGSDDVGIHFPNSSETFLEAFASADVILGKGHGNFETCNTRAENLYFLLKAKCRLVAAELGVNLGDLVFKHIPAAV